MTRKVLKNIWSFLQTIRPDQVQYVKTLTKNNMVEGEFDNEDDFVNAFKSLPEMSLYTIPNKIKENVYPDDEINILYDSEKGRGIKKEDIQSREYLFIDFDVVHKEEREISATEEEHERAYNLVERVYEYLKKEHNFPDPIICDSGNGYYLLYKTEELENNDETDSIFKDVTRALANKFNTGKVIIDSKVHNANRLIKAIGCKATKGIETEDRKHRYSKLVSVPETIIPVSKEKLLEIVKLGITLKSKPTKQSSGSNGNDDEISVADKIAESIERSAEFYLDQNQEPWATCDHASGEIRSYPLESGEFKRWAQRIICNELGTKTIKKDYYNQALAYWTMLAYESNKVIRMQNRIAVNDAMTEIIYDCNSPDNKSVLIKDGNILLIDTPQEVFRREKADAPQVKPNLAVDHRSLISYIEKYFNCATHNDLILLATYIVTCFLGSKINHAIMIFSGSKGSAKSTATRYIQQLVSPQITGITTMSKKVDDVAVRLSHSVLAVFDNLSQISEGISDLLCVAVTGGTYPKRKLFTDNEEIYLQLKAMIIMNGVNVVAEKSDLLDRSINIELKRLTKDTIKSPLELDAMFRDDLPNILGAIMKTVAIAINDVEEVKTDELIRMADFHIWGIKVAKALGVEQHEFEEALLGNRMRINEKAIEHYPVAALLMDFVEDKPSWVGSVSKLHSDLTKLAINQNINTHQAKFPKDAGALSRRLKEVESNLAEVGIRFSIRNVGSYKEIEVTNSNAKETNKRKVMLSKKAKEELMREDDDSD